MQDDFLKKLEESLDNRKLDENALELLKTISENQLKIEEAKNSVGKKIASIVIKGIVSLGALAIVFYLMFTGQFNPGMAWFPVVAFILAVGSL
jgi:Fe2+ transport system protein B